MTEKEFLKGIIETAAVPSFALSNAALKALELAKLHGAKFDPEPIELPQLCIAERDHDQCDITLTRTRYISPNVMSPRLSYDQAKEVVRRCELIPRIRKYITDRYLRLSNGQITEIGKHVVVPFNVGNLLDMLDGKGKES